MIKKSMLITNRNVTLMLFFSFLLLSL